METNIVGLSQEWRPAKDYDSYRIGVGYPTVWVSKEHQATLRELNAYLKTKKLRKEVALDDTHVQRLIQRLQYELKNEHGLKEVKARAALAYVTRRFNFDNTLEDYVRYKSDTVVAPFKHVPYLREFWFPFFRERSCEHPSEWKTWKREAKSHIKTATKLESTERYSPETWVSLASALNEYMKYLKEEEYISEADFFAVHVSATKKSKRDGRNTSSRSRGVYSNDDLIKIKEAIDKTYKDNMPLKLRAYALYFGVCTGLRRGNILGLRVSDLYPDKGKPYFTTRDNILPGWAEGVKGDVIRLTETKTFVGVASLPMLQPSPSILSEVAAFLIANLKSDDRLIECNSSSVGRYWAAIAKECGFKYVSPHGWKHSYATNGAQHFTEWYKSNAYFLQMCCLHEDYRTTNNYINQDGKQFLDAFFAAKKKRGSSNGN